MVLCDLGQNNGKGPIIARDMGRFDMTLVYDFLRHAEPGMLHDSVDFAPEFNQWMLFDGIWSFKRLYGGRTAFMRTFEAYYALWPSPTHPKLREKADTFLPEGLSIEEAEVLTRSQFFAKGTEMFANQIRRSGGGLAI